VRLSCGVMSSRPPVLQTGCDRGKRRSASGGRQPSRRRSQRRVDLGRFSRRQVRRASFCCDMFRIVVSSDSMKKATATSQGSSRLLAAEGNRERRGRLAWPLGRTGLQKPLRWMTVSFAINLMVDPFQDQVS